MNNALSIFALFIILSSAIFSIVILFNQNEEIINKLIYFIINIIVIFLGIKIYRSAAINYITFYTNKIIVKMLFGKELKVHKEDILSINEISHWNLLEYKIAVLKTKSINLHIHALGMIEYDSFVKEMNQFYD